MFITFEGIDGSGKTSLVKKMSMYCTATEQSFYQMDTFIGASCDLIECILNHSEAGFLSPMAEAFFFLGLQSQRQGPIRYPTQHTFMDRYTDSTLAYQGYGRGLDIDWLKGLCGVISEGSVPDLTFLLDIEPTLAMQRKPQPIPAFENMWDVVDLINRHETYLRFYTTVREGYLEIAKQNPERIFVIDASLPKEQVYKIAQTEFEKRNHQSKKQ